MGGGSPWARPDTGGASRELEVFATHGTVAVVRGPAADDRDPLDARPPVGEQLRRGGDAVRHALDHARSINATPGHRLGAAPLTTSRRRGSGADVVRPVLVDPVRSGEIAADGALFGAPNPHLELVEASPTPLTWRVAVTGERRFPATLHLLASPSLVVTVIELIPERRLRWGRDGFVRDGVAAADRLAAILVAAVEAAERASGGPDACP